MRAVMKIPDESLAYEISMVVLYIHSCFIVQLQVSVFTCVVILLRNTAQVGKIFDCK